MRQITVVERISEALRQLWIALVITGVPVYGLWAISQLPVQ